MDNKPTYVMKNRTRYVYKNCEQCGEEALMVANRGRFCSRSCSVKRAHANGLMPRPAKGENSPNWRGAEVSYKRMHSRIYETRGKAEHCSNPGCESPKTTDHFEWSWIHDTDPADIYNYRPLCRPCHVKYDHLHGEGHGNSKLTMDQARAIRAIYAAGGVTYVQLAALYGLKSHSVIGQIVRGISYREDLLPQHSDHN